MNKVILIGNLTKDPERRVTRSGVTTCSFTLAVERDHKDKDGNRPVDFINVIAWRNTADLCARYLTKGRQAAVIGTWQNRSYEDKDGNKRTVAECIADDVQFLGGPRREAAPQAYEDYDDPFPEEKRPAAPFEERPPHKPPKRRRLHNGKNQKPGLRRNNPKGR